MTDLILWDNAKQAIEEARTITWGNFHELPSESGVYIVCDGERILYVGQSKNMRRRWTRHHRKQQINNLQSDNIKIAFLLLSEKELASAERMFIAVLKPVFNGKSLPRARRQTEELIKFRAAQEKAKNLYELFDLVFGDIPWMK